MEEAEALSKKHTQRALQQLREHLSEHPAQAELLMDRLREDGKKEQVGLLDRFVKGRSPGVPYTVQSDDDRDSAAAGNGGGSGCGGFCGLLRMIVVLVIIAVTGYYFVVVYQRDDGSDEM